MKTHNLFYGKDGQIDLSLSKIFRLIVHLRFAKYYPLTSKSPILVQSKNGIIEETSESMIKDALMKFVDDNVSAEDQMTIKSTIIEKSASIKKTLFDMLPPLDVKWKRDSATECYFYFLNGFVTVTKDSLTFKKYDQLDGFIWRKHIIEQEIQIDLADPESSMFKDFLMKVSNCEEERYDSLRTNIGYLLSSYKDRSNCRAIVFMDTKLASLEESNGGNGKSLTSTAIGHLKTLQFMPGKQFNSGDKFSMQTINEGDQIIMIDDITDKFDFQDLFPVLTGEFRVEKKYQGAFNLPFESSPKIVISTNFVLSGEGSSYERRKAEFEFSDYFNADNTPLDEYGKLLFDQWDSKEWNDFFVYMMGNCQYYLQQGLKIAPSVNIEDKKLLMKTSYEFADFIKSRKLKGEIEKGKLYIDFIQEQFDGDKSFVSIRLFSKWIKNYCSLKKLRCSTRKSNGKTFFQFG